MTLMVGDGMPELGEVRVYLDLPESVLTDEDLDRMWTAARTNQLAQVRDEVAAIPEDQWPAALVSGLLRRVQRAIAARNLPLGYLADAESGAARLLNYDAVIEEHEGPFRKVVVA